MDRNVAKSLGASLLLAGLTACGGSGGSGGTMSSGPTTSPTPPPSPTPTPTPTPTPSVAFTPVPAALFDTTPYNPDLKVLGHGWTSQLPTPSALSLLPNPKVADDLTASYDAATNTYLLDAGIAGNGRLFRMGPIDNGSFPASIETDAAALVGTATELQVNPTSPTSKLHYTALISPWVTRPDSSTMATLYYGWFAVTQPTRDADLPHAGITRFETAMNGWFSQDAGGTFISATPVIDFDFSSFTATGSFRTNFGCMMGCSAPEVNYTITGKGRQGTGTLFTGEISTPGAPWTGNFIGTMAGPAADEIVLSVEFPYFNSDHGIWMTFGGVIAGRKAP